MVCSFTWILGVAYKIGATRSAAVRLKSGKGANSTSLATDASYAEALGCRLEVELIRKWKKAVSATAPALGNTGYPAELLYGINSH